MPAYPSNGKQNLRLWAAEFIKKSESHGQMPTTNFGTLGKLYEKHLPKLCVQKHASKEQQDSVIAAYKLLTKSIRNRDAHAYVPHVRGDHHYLVSFLFTECFNILVKWLPSGPETLNAWLDEAESAQMC